MAFDYMSQIEETIVAEGIEGKIIIVYGGNNLGKSSQFAKIPNNIFLPFESNALNAIGGVKKLPVSDYATFKDFVESMKSDKEKLEKLKASLPRIESKLEKMKLDDEVDKEDIKETEDKISDIKDKIEKNSFRAFKEKHPILTVDSITALDKSAEKFVTDAYDVVDLGDVAHGKLYKRFENEFYHCINDFLNLGFTYLFTAHSDYGDTGLVDEDGEKIKKLYPKGNYKRVVKPIIDRSDIIIYLKSNGTDENNKVINSSGHLAETPEYFARTKWDNMETTISNYTYDNLCKVIDKAISEQKDSGMKVGSFEEQQKHVSESMGVDYEELINQIGTMVREIYTFDEEDAYGANMTRYNEMVEGILGMDKKVSDCNAKQTDHLQLILSKTKDIHNSLK